MRAAVWSEPGLVQVEQVPTPVAGPGEVLVRVAYCGFCGTDASIIAGRFPAGRPPRVIGHEVSGTVADVGPQVFGLTIGDQVACNPFASCERCAECLANRKNHCTNRYTATAGMAEYAVYRAQQVHPVPEGVPLRCAALAEPLGNALYGIERAVLGTDQRVVVFGGGTIGQLTAAMAHRLGASEVVLVDPDERKLLAAIALGVSAATSPESLSDRDFDIAFEATGSRDGLAAALNSLGTRGRLVVQALHAPSTSISIDAYDLARRELSVTGTWSAAGTFDQAVGWLGRLDVDLLITDVVPLEAVAEIYATHGAPGRIKALLSP